MSGDRHEGVRMTSSELYGMIWSILKHKLQKNSYITGTWLKKVGNLIWFQIGRKLKNTFQIASKLMKDILILTGQILPGITLHYHFSHARDRLAVKWFSYALIFLLHKFFYSQCWWLLVICIIEFSVIFILIVIFFLQM